MSSLTERAAAELARRKLETAVERIKAEHRCIVGDCRRPRARFSKLCRGHQINSWVLAATTPIRPGECHACGAEIKDGGCPFC